MPHAAFGPLILSGSYLLLVLLALGLLIGACWLERRWRLIKDLPTSKPGGVCVGLVEVVGTIRCATPVTSRLTDARCVWYRWSIEEQWSRAVTTTSTDAQGHTTTSTSRESGWTTIASGGDERPFTLSDESGSVLVRPGGAQVHAASVLDTTCGRANPWYYGKGPQAAISNSDHQRHFHEWLLPLERSGYVIGQARQSPDQESIEISLDGHAPLFAISLRGQDDIASGYFWKGLVCKILGLAVAVGGAWYLNQDDAQVALEAALAAVLYLVLCAVGWFWLVHNSLVELRQRVHQGWANIDVQLTRRFDLITQLLPLVQAITGHEAVTQQAVACMRQQQQATPPGAPGPDVAVLAPLLARVVEAYPDLIAQAQFARLQQALVDCENRVALSRSYFNDIVTSWNTRLGRFPDVLVARLGGMRPSHLMQDFPGAQVAPVVQLSTPTRH